MNNAHSFKYRSLGMELLFIVIILYAVSSFFILGIALGMLPYLHYKLYLKPNIEYAAISFVLTAIISVYHLSIMFRLKKRRTDHIENVQLAETVHWFRKRTALTQALFILIVLHAAGSIGVLLALLPGFIPLNQAGLPYVCIGYSMVSFVAATLISACHLSTMVRRRKRKTDRGAEGQAHTPVR